MCWSMVENYSKYLPYIALDCEYYISQIDYWQLEINNKFSEDLQSMGHVSFPPSLWHDKRYDVKCRILSDFHLDAIVMFLLWKLFLLF